LKCCRPDEAYRHAKKDIEELFLQSDTGVAGEKQMIPYFPQPSLHLFGPVYLHGFGTMVAVALITAWWITTARSRKEGLDPDRMQDMFGWVVVTGFIVAHLYSVLAYYPREVMRNPLMLLKIWENISSFGGIAGGILGLWLYFRFKGGDIGFKERVRYMDVIAYTFPFGWLFGRLGCTLAHDHPGAITSFPLAISLESAAARNFIRTVYEEAGRQAELLSNTDLSRLGFHDLGWYEFLFTALFLVPVFLLLGRKKRAPGFYIIVFLLLYIPARFMLDFLRVADVTYLGLTPGQYAAAAVFAALLVLVFTGFPSKLFRGDL